MVDEALIEKFILTPAERAVLLEQCEASKVVLDDLMRHIQEGGPRSVKRMLETWTELTNAYEFMSNLLNNKTQKAIHAVYLEQRDQ